MSCVLGFVAFFASSAPSSGIIIIIPPSLIPFLLVSSFLAPFMLTSTPHTLYTTDTQGPSLRTHC